MFRWEDKGLSSRLITIFTALVVMTSACLGDEDPHQFTDFAAGGTEGSAEWMDNALPFPVKEPALLTENETIQFASLKMGLQRVFIPCGAHHADAAYCQPSLGPSSNIRSLSDVKNTILLKLRI
jgi:hypothetical protein